MQTLRNRLIAIAALGTLAVFGSFMGSRPVAAAGGPSVTIDGPLPLPVKDAENPARSAFQATLCNGVNLTTQCGTTPSKLTTPNRRVVVEYASGFCLASANASPTTLILTTTVSGVSTFHTAGVPQLIFFDGSTRSIGFAQSVRIYADPVTDIQFAPDFLGSFTGGLNYCKVTLSGHTVAP